LTASRIEGTQAANALTIGSCYNGIQFQVSGTPPATDLVNMVNAMRITPYGEVGIGAMETSVGALLGYKLLVGGDIKATSNIIDGNNTKLSDLLGRIIELESSGVAGADGATGAKGDTGDTGAAGAAGANGAAGAAGANGAAGAKGDTGAQGIQGEVGAPASSNLFYMWDSGPNSTAHPGDGFIRMYTGTTGTAWDSGVTRIIMPDYAPGPTYDSSVQWWPNGKNIKDWIASWTTFGSTGNHGIIEVIKVNDRSVKLRGKVTGVIWTDKANGSYSTGGWSQVEITYLDHDGSDLEDVELNDAFYVVFTPTGSKGNTGAAGAAGAKGDTGAAGAAGAKGDTGAAGAAGAKGDTGAAGAAGAKGDTGGAGAKGDTGAAGAAGAAGAKGAAGAAGAKGDTGEDGAQGPQGPQGPAGADGMDGGGGGGGTISITYDGEPIGNLASIRFLSAGQTWYTLDTGEEVGVQGQQIIRSGPPKK